MQEVKMLEVSKLKPYKNNSKIHNNEQIKKIAESIKKFGFRIPIITDKKLVIISGHGRYKASKILELGKVPVIVLEDISEEDARALRIADNKLTLKTGLDNSAIAKEFNELMNVDFSVLGFTDMEIHDIEKDASFFETEDFDINEFEEFLSVDKDNKMAVKKSKEQKTRKIICPHCKKEFEIE